MFLIASSTLCREEFEKAKGASPVVGRCGFVADSDAKSGQVAAAAVSEVMVDTAAPPSSAHAYEMSNPCWEQPLVRDHTIGTSDLEGELVQDRLQACTENFEAVK
jgi:hypothetical protein